MSDDSAQGSTDSMPLEARIAELLGPLGEHSAVAARRLAHPPSLSGMDAALIAIKVDASGARQAERQESAGDGEVLVRAEAALPMGALARLAVAVEMLRRVDLGQFDLDEPLPDLAAEEAAARTLGAACARMLTAEEPAAMVATAALTELVGLGEINETLSALKLKITHLAHEVDGAELPAWRQASTTSAGEMLTLLGLLSGSAIPNAAWLRATLATQARMPELRAALPAEAELAYLPAMRGRACHAAGWLRGPGGGGAFCVLLAEVDDPRRAAAALARIVGMFWMAWCAG